MSGYSGSGHSNCRGDAVSTEKRGLSLDVDEGYRRCCLALALAGCGSAPRVARYRFTVEVDDNGRSVTGSSVQEEHCTFNDGFFKGIGNALDCGVKGESVVVDLGAKATLRNNRIDRRRHGRACPGHPRG
jgi:hypothetical protein